MEVSRLGLNQSYSCWPTPQPWQRQILNPLSEARDRTWIFMDTSRVRYHWATMGTPKISKIFIKHWLIKRKKKKQLVPAWLKFPWMFSDKFQFLCPEKGDFYFICPYLHTRRLKLRWIPNWNLSPLFCAFLGTLGTHDPFWGWAKGQGDLAEPGRDGSQGNRLTAEPEDLIEVKH